MNRPAPHLARTELVERVFATMKSSRQRFFLFVSPGASGKTSLLQLFADRYPHLNCIYISFLDPDQLAVELLRSCRIDLYGETTSLDPNQDHVVMVDDAQAKYDETGFWHKLVKVASMWLPDNIRFIICATHALEGGVASPVEFQSLLKFSRRDFVLSDAEAEQFLMLPTTGLPEKMKKQAFVQLLIRECGGLIGALRISIDAVVSFFAKDPSPSETELIVYYLSQDCLQLMARCFGVKHTTVTSVNLQQFLIQCLVVAPNVVSLSSMLADEDDPCFLNLKKGGIIVEDDYRLVRFSSPLAEKYYSKWLLPNRAFENPSSLRDLIEKVVGSMSASALRQSIVGKSNFPKEATFQHQFMQGLALNTHVSCSICPELSRVFPASPNGGDQALRINGEIDFYLNGTLRWGIELLVNGDKIGEHMARFAEGGKYSALGVKDYAVVDLRGNPTGEVTNVSRMEKRVTLFFQLNDFSCCRCIFGLDGSIFEIRLKN
ncbi:hypothetical protein AC1031_000005 [Aphanomyces cochlioides]|nr:hypothetical protein AC1031_000005 [Aphanomyces cochlioides]